MSGPFLPYVAKSCCGGASSTRWDSSDKQWKCADCGSIKSNDPDYFNSAKQSLTPKAENLFAKKCECGSQKTYGETAGHSVWCPKYTKV